MAKKKTTPTPFDDLLNSVYGNEGNMPETTNMDTQDSFINVVEDKDKPADNDYLSEFPASEREQQRAIINDQIVDAGHLKGLVPGNADGNIPINNGINSYKPITNFLLIFFLPSIFANADIINNNVPDNIATPIAPLIAFSIFGTCDNKAIIPAIAATTNVIVNNVLITPLPTLSLFVAAITAASDNMTAPKAPAVVINRC